MRNSLFPQTGFGGDLYKGKRKAARPFEAKKPMHVVFRSTRARGAWSFLHRRNKANVHLLFLGLTEKYGAKVHGYENVGNHLHFLLKFRTRREMQNFLRVFSQRLMFLITGARKGSPRGRFFDAIAFSKVVSWGEHYRTMKDYLWKNALEGFGLGAQTVRDWRKSAREVPLYTQKSRNPSRNPGLLLTRKIRD